MDSKRGPKDRKIVRTNLVRNLEEKARHLASRVSENPWRPSISATVEREIAFILHKIDSTYRLHEDIERSIVRSECSVGTQLANLSPHESGYLSYRFDSREKQFNRKLHAQLVARMDKIDEERRRLAQTHADRLHALHGELLDLIERHRHVSNAIRD